MAETYVEPGALAEAPLLEVDDLFVEFRTRDGVAKVLNGVSYHVNAGETLAVLGESGSGKSVTAQAIMGILDIPPAVITGGEIRYHGENLLAVSDERRNDVRAEGVAIVFQDALSALNPVYTVGFQIEEPTTALDVTVQAQIMDLLTEIQAERRMGLILITHDLGVVAEVADRIAVMYAGRIVEHADAMSLYRNPGHPYTAALMDSLPRLDQKGSTLNTIKGLPPSLLHIPPG